MSREVTASLGQTHVVTITDTANLVNNSARAIRGLIDQLEYTLFGNEEEKQCEAPTPNHVHGSLKDTESVLGDNERALNDILCRVKSSGGMKAAVSAYGKAKDIPYNG